MPLLVPAVILRGASEALSTLRRNPLRSSLAGLAMAAAVATTAVVQTGLDGLAQSARDASARAFGSDSFIVARVASGVLSRRELADKLERNPAITRSDARFLDSVAGGRVLYAAIAQRPADISAGGRKYENAAVNGTQSTLFDIRDIGIERGRFLTRDEEVTAAQVLVAGHAITDELFPGVDPIGRSVRIGRREFRVVGVQSPQGTAGGVSLDRYAWMPITTFERTFGAAASLQLFAKAPGRAPPASAEDRARTSLRARRHLGPGTPDNFDIITPEASRSFVTAITERAGAAGPPISAMALLAAMIVVANTTLVSITQRTREIGIRRAVGASRASVLVETLAESSVVALLGGGAGLLLAAGVLSVASPAVSVPLALDWSTMLGSLAAAGASGIVAGWYPARRAAGLDIITALRYES